MSNEPEAWTEIGPGPELIHSDPDPDHVRRPAGFTAVLVQPPSG